MGIALGIAAWQVGGNDSEWLVRAMRLILPVMGASALGVGALVAWFGAVLARPNYMDVAGSLGLRFVLGPAVLAGLFVAFAID